MIKRRLPAARPIDTPQTLEKQIKEQRDKLHSLENKLDKLLNDQELPKLKAKYTNTYWVYENGYNGQEKWNMYCHCLSVTNHREFLVETFQTDSRGEISIHRQTTGDHLFEKKITKREFETTLNRIIKKVSQFKK